MPNKELKLGVQKRTIELTREIVDKKSRTIELAFSSETPVERWWGEEVLDHSPDSVRLERLNTSGPLLRDHNTANHIAVIESARIDSDRKGRLIARFGKSAKAKEAFKDVKDRILVHASVGYRIHKAVLESTGKDVPDRYRITDWEPLEVSLVPIPADTNCGIGRSADSDEQKVNIIINNEEEVRAMPKPTAPELADIANKSAGDIAVAIEDVREQEQNRIRKISAMGEKYHLGEESREFIRSGKTAEEFYEHVFSEMENETRGQPLTHLDLSNGEQKNYSIVRAINASITGDWSKAGFERECSLEIETRLDKTPEGFFVPYDIQKRDQQVGDPALGGNLVATDHLAGSFIDNLRAQSIVMAMGARALPGLVGDVDIPRKDTSATFSWVGEDGSPTQSDINIGLVSLSPKTLTGKVYMTRRLLKQSTPAIDELVMSDLAKGAALGIDYGALNGSGVGDEPTGLFNQAGLNTQTIVVAGKPTWVELVGFETELGEDNALADNLYYIMPPGVVGHAKTTTKDAGSGRFLLEEGRINDYMTSRSTQVATNRIGFGNFSDLMIGLWGVLDVYPERNVDTGGLTVCVYQDADIAIRHAESFCVDA